MGIPLTLPAMECCRQPATARRGCVAQGVIVVGFKKGRVRCGHVALGCQVLYGMLKGSGQSLALGVVVVGCLLAPAIGCEGGSVCCSTCILYSAFPQYTVFYHNETLNIHIWHSHLGAQTVLI